MDQTLTSPRIWKAEHVRFTAFPTGPLDLAAATDWWANLVGAPPQSLSMQQGALLQAAGPFGQGNLSLVCTTAGEARVDLLLGPISQTPVELPGVGEANQSIVLVQRVFEKWLDFGIAVKRVGVSGAILSNVSTKVEGYEALAGLLDAVEIDEARMFSWFEDIEQSNSGHEPADMRKPADHFRIRRHSAEALKSKPG